MKRLIAALLVGYFLFVGNTAIAQQTFTVNEVYQYMSRGQNTGLEIPLYGTKKEDAESAFEKFVKQYKGKFTPSSKKNSEIFVDNAIIKEISPNTVDIYVTAYPTDYGSKMSVFIDLGGAFVSSHDHPQAFAAMTNIFKEFARQEAIRLSDEQVEAEAEILENYQDELDDLAADKIGYVKDIEKSKSLIAQKESDIAMNAQKQPIQQQQIEAQKAKIQSASAEQLKAEEKILKSLQKELDNLVSDKADYLKDIEKAKALIAQREADIPVNDQNQSIKQQQILIQQNIVQIVKDKRASLGK